MGWWLAIDSLCVATYFQLSGVVQSLSSRLREIQLFTFSSAVQRQYLGHMNYSHVKTVVSLAVFKALSHCLFRSYLV